MEVKHERVVNWKLFALENIQKSWQVALTNRRNIEAFAPVDNGEDAAEALARFVERVQEQTISVLRDE